ncbi:MAG: hypothetical protein ACYC9Q_08960 [Bacillota bacterium]
MRAGDVLAAAVCLGHPRVARSPADGHVTMVSRRLGYVYIREALAPVGADAPPVTVPVFPDLVLPKPIMSDCLLVREGDEVRFGQALASSNAIRLWKQTFSLGRTAKEESCVAPVGGTVERTDFDSRTITIQPKETTSFVAAGVPGRVTAVNQDSIDLAVHGLRFVGAYGTGGEVMGPLSLDDRPSGGTVWVRFGRVTIEELDAARSAGALAIWAASAAYEDLRSFVGDRPLGAVSRVGPGPVVIISEGFGDFRLPSAVADELRALGGRRALVDGTTHLRAGAIRPEMIIFEEGDEGGPVEDRRDERAGKDRPSDDWPTPGAQPIAVGDEVRCFAGLNLGRTGRVARMPMLGRLESGLSTMVADVDWVDGEHSTVAARNLARLAPAVKRGGRHDGHQT